MIKAPEVQRLSKKKQKARKRDHDPGLLSLPTYVITDILDYVSIHDVLQFRATSKKASQFVVDYRNRLKKRLPKVTKVFKTEEQFQQVWDTVSFAPYQQFSFNFKIRYGVMKEITDRFLHKCGKEITLLHVQELHIWMDGDEINFYKKIPNLNELSVVEIKQWRNGYSILDSVRENNIRPGLTNQPTAIRSIHLNFIPSLPDTIRWIQILKFFKTKDPFLIHLLLSHCTNIKILYYGLLMEPEGMTPKDTQNLKSSHFWNILHYFGQQNVQISASSECNVVFGINSINQVDPNLVDQFCDLLRQKKMFLSGISPDFLAQIVSRPNHEALLNSIKITNVVTAFLTTMELKSLMCVNFKIHAKNFDVLNGEIAEVPNRNWPLLGILKFIIDLPQARIKEFSGTERNVMAFLKFLFFQQRPQLKYLMLLTGNLKSKQFIMPRNLCFSVPSLISLILDIPAFSCEDVCQLFSELGEQTRIKFLNITIRCPVNDSHFIGDNEASPNFLKMKELRHCMINVIMTPNQVRCFPDTPNEKRNFLETVLPQSSLTCLTLESRRRRIFPITINTVSGILNGNLGNTLRYLSWNDGQPIRTRSTECSGVWKSLNSKIKKNRTSYLLNDGDKCPKCRST